jgi:hypothetical protein
MKKKGLIARRHQRIYHIWKGMRNRCFNPNNKDYHLYGGRGISVCERWSEFDNFTQDMAATYAGDLKLNRINNDGNYEPGNCEWTNQKTQSLNTRRNVVITIDGVSKPLMSWVEHFGARYEVARHRIVELGWEAKKALSTPTIAPGTNTRKGHQGFHKTT